MADVAPHLAFPLRFRAGRFLTVDQDSQRHREDQAEVVLRTRPGDFEHDPELGLRELVGRTAPAAPEVLAAVSRVVDASFDVREDVDDLRPRVRDVSIAVRDEDQEG